MDEDYRYNYFYDENGNMIKKQVKGHLDQFTSYDYNSENQMTQIRVYDSGSSNPIKTVSYVYDPMGRRVLKEIVDHNSPSNSFSRGYVYQNNEIIEEYDGSQNLLAQYGHSYLRTDDPLSMRVTSEGVSAGISQNVGIYTFLKDAQGSVTEITDSNGTIKQRYHYSSFGKILSIRDSGDNDVTLNPIIKTPFAYTGREYDSESELYYYRARMYNPEIGRFLQKDPSPGKMADPASVVNSYAYVSNNPWNMTDPSGKFGFLVALLYTFVASAAVAGVTTVVQVGLDGWNWHKSGVRFLANFAVTEAMSLIGLFTLAKAGADYSIKSGFLSVTSADLPAGTFGASFGTTLGFSSGAPGASIFLHEAGHALLTLFPMIGLGTDRGFKLSGGDIGGTILGGVLAGGTYGTLAWLAGPLEVPGIRNLFEGMADVLPGTTMGVWHELGTPFGL